MKISTTLLISILSGLACGYCNPFTTWDSWGSWMYCFVWGVITIAIIFLINQVIIAPWLDKFCPNCGCYWGFTKQGALVLSGADSDWVMYPQTLCPDCARKLREKMQEKP